jgi:hypothetical protein
MAWRSPVSIATPGVRCPSTVVAPHERRQDFDVFNDATEEKF